MNPLIFRQYDIRGIVDKDLTPEVVTALGRGYGSFILKRGLKTVTLGRDGRESSPRFRDFLCEGILSTGCDVIDIDMVPTPLLYFSLFHLNTDGGVMITGSHNPADFNGFKVCANKTSMFGDDIQEIRKIIEQGDFAKGSGRKSAYNIIDPYIEMVKEKITLKKEVKVVVDAGNGMGGVVAPRLMREMGVNIAEEMYCTVDGKFPNHHPDPTVIENLSDIIAKVKEKGVDVGIAYDGDADRIGTIDDKGNIIWGDNLMILFSREILGRKPGAKIIFEVKCSQNLVDDIKRHGGEPIMWKTGHSLIKKKMKEEKAELAGEMSGHIFFSDRYLGYDDAIYASMRLLEILSGSSIPLSEMLIDVPKTYSTPEIRVDCPDEEKFKLVDTLKEYFKKHYEVIDIDGVRVLFKQGWGLMRASNTQPVIVLRFESGSEQGLEEIKDIVRKKIKEVNSDISGI